MSAKGQGPTAKSQIQKMKNRRWTWAGAIGELVDNSCGNGATNVTIRLTPKTCEVRDDGNGCTELMFAAMQSFGWHQEDEEHENNMSRFGVGAKDAVIWAGGPTEFYSIRDTARAITVDWDSFGRDWTYPDPEEGDIAFALCSRVRLTEHGTIVKMSHHTRQAHRGMVEDLRRALNAQHWAAVESGAVIRFEFLPLGGRRVLGGVLPGKPLPTLKEGTALDKLCSLSDGRTFRIIGGVLDPSARLSDPGFEYIFGHRVVVAAGGLGAGNMSFERVCCRVFLEGDKTGWLVTANKDGLHDSDQQALGEAVFRECQSILNTAQSESISSVLEKEIEDSLSAVLTDSHKRRGKRKPPQNNSGSVAPTGRGGKHKNFTVSQPGDTETDSEPKLMKGGRVDVKIIEFEDKDAHLIAKAVVKDRTVRLNKRHSLVAEGVAKQFSTEMWALIASPFWVNAWIHTDDGGNKYANGCERMGFDEKLSAMLGTTVKEETATPA